MTCRMANANTTEVLFLAVEYVPCSAILIIMFCRLRSILYPFPGSIPVVHIYCSQK